MNCSIVYPDSEMVFDSQKCISIMAQIDEENEIENQIEFENNIVNDYFEKWRNGEINSETFIDENEAYYENIDEELRKIEAFDNMLDDRLDEQNRIDRELWYMNDEEKDNYFIWLNKMKEECERFTKLDIENEKLDEIEMENKRRRDEENGSDGSDCYECEYINEDDCEREYDSKLIVKASRRFMYI